MKRRKKLCLLWRELNSLELGKDVMLVPYYLGKSLNYDIEICMNFTDEQRDLVTQYIERTGVQIKRKAIGFTPFKRISAYFQYLLKNARKTDLLMCFHWRTETYFSILLYKLLNPKGRVYIKLDTDSGNEFNILRHKGLKRLFIHTLYSVCIHHTDCLSCETSHVFETICNNKNFGDILKNKLILMPNGFDEELLETLNIKEYSYTDKENLIITVGRIGSEQKNSEMFLNALANIDLKDWKVCFIGPISPPFKTTIENFFYAHPEKQKQVTFIGSIDDKKILWQWYNRAKVFVLTSRWESFGIVLTEAKRFNNYILSTPVGTAPDIIIDKKNGRIIKNDDYLTLSSIIQEIITNGINKDDLPQISPSLLSWNTLVKKITKIIRKV